MRFPTTIYHASAQYTAKCHPASGMMAHTVLGQRSAHYGAHQFLALARLRKACTSYSEAILIKLMARCSGSWSRRSRRRIADPSNQRFPLDINPAVELEVIQLGLNHDFLAHVNCGVVLGVASSSPTHGNLLFDAHTRFTSLLQAREVTAMVRTTASNSIPAARLFSLAHRVLQRIFCGVANMCVQLCT